MMPSATSEKDIMVLNIFITPSAIGHSPLCTSSEHASAVACSACCYHALEHVWMLPVVMPEGKFVEIEWQIVLRHFMECPHDAAFDERPEAIKVIGMDVAVDVFAHGVAHDLVRETCVQHAIAWVFIRGDQIDLLRDCLMNKPRQGEL